MPVKIHTIDEIMARRKRDTFFIQFRGPRSSRTMARREHLAWFDRTALRYEMAAPRGWLEGDPGLFVVYFDDTDDPRLGQYSTLFEDPDGRSRSPDDYQMVLLPFESWLNDPARSAARV
ncbi:hypothetical protein JKG68_10745 [Microvirga aerilata]|uniref:Uncharacterized protein n=1 Tax=Microvirga aerilata TaxID=670292 RepID=A0A937CZ95_9HYPH|nr:hypothetical protein [Microvirga aerilata]MBL0404446.1 hypothetical protein [Microvirga aerilata]